MTTASWKRLHHLTRPLVLSAVFRCTRSRTTIYPCSSRTCARLSESLRTIEISLARLFPLLHWIHLPRWSWEVSVCLTLGLQRILRHLRLRHVDNSVHIEGNLLWVGGPTLIAEAVVVLAVGLGCERVILVGDGLLVVLAVAKRVLDLDETC